MRPDFETMSGPELVDVYNKLATEAAGLPIKDVAAVKKFKTVDVGRKRCSELWIKIAAAKSGEAGAAEKEKPDGAQTTEAVASPTEEAETSSERDTTMATRKKSSKASKANARGKTKGATKKGAKGPAKKRAVKAFETRTVAGFPATSKIEVLVDGNPRREGTAGHKRFAEYSKSKTIAEYYKKFPAKAHSDISWDLEHKHIKIVKKA